MVVWTVETWRIKNGREGHFLEYCRDLAPDVLTLYRDLDAEGLFWSPTRWDSREALEDWWDSSRYATALKNVADDVIEHETHVMTAVEGLLPAAR